MTSFNVEQAKTDLSKLIADALRGEEVVIAQDQEPVIRLVPIRKTKPRRAGRLKGRIGLTPAFFEPLSQDEIDAWIGESV